MSAHSYFTLRYILGYPRIENYDGSFSEWANLDELPIETGVGKPSAGGGDTVLDGQKLVQERCAYCHKVERVYKAHKDPVGWEKTVDRMNRKMIRKGTPLNEAERQSVIDYLSSR